MKFPATLALLALAAGTACSAGEARMADAPAADGHLFTRLPAAYTGVRFENRLASTRAFNVFTYRNFYNGGGVAVGDLTGDGLPEVVLTANQGGARVYLNEGRFRFRDVTDAAGLGKTAAGWTTGVTLADVNGDGRLDLYLCKAGQGAPAERANQLWINRGAGADSVPTFGEEARAYGVADEGWSTQAAWLDYDRDGDLDLFVVNNSPKPANSFGPRNTRTVRDQYGGAKLYRHDRGPNGAPRFTETGAAAGIHSPEIAFGLGLAVADVNRDGWPDVYVSNDFFERDYLYLNNRDGTFAEALDRRAPALSYYSMGLDVADVDNDGWPDVYTTDMLPEDEYRLKTVSAFEGWDPYQNKVRLGFHHQLMRNMLQLNNGDWGAPNDTTRGTFSDVGQMAGVARTDWSWGALVADLDQDGRKDVFVTNGVAKDVTDQDYVAYLADAETMRAVTANGKDKVDFTRLVDAMQSTRIPNYAFRAAPDSLGALRFANAAAAWGLDTPTFSSGAAYGDLDGDGAPDLVVNNVDQEAFVYRNNARALTRNHWLAVRLEGAGANRFAVGARVAAYAGGEQFVQELSPARGFQSSVDYALTFGLGAHAAVDSLRVDWPDGRATVQRAVGADRRLTLRQADASAAPNAVPPSNAAPAAPRLADVTAAAALGYAHRENEFVDFDRDRLIPKMVSTEGPAVAAADVDGDGLDDVFLGGAKGQVGQLLLQRPGGRFVRGAPGAFEPDSVSEDVGAVFFDANGDRRPDLYVVSGGNEFPDFTSALQDRLYLNDGGGRFHKAEGALPSESVSGSRAAAADVDGDGDLDLFVGGRVVPFQYGAPPRSLLLVNDGRGRFTDATDRLAPALKSLGMVTDAVWRDTDGDGRPDLVVVGEWMPVTVLHNAGGGRLAPRPVRGLEHSGGWWNRVAAADVDGDGRTDFVLGNLGTNTRLHASPSEPATLVVKDFDHNGQTEQILGCYNQGRDYPVALRDDLLRALPAWRARFPDYKTYARQTMRDLLPDTAMAGAAVLRAETFASAVARANADGSYTLVPLPEPAQRAPVYGILARDVDGDGRTDLLLAGNFDGFRPDVGRASASAGLVLRGDGRGGFTPMPHAESGFAVPGQTRDLVRLRTGGGADLVLAARNNDRPLVFRVQPKAATVARAVGRSRPQPAVVPSAARNLAVGR